MDHSEIGFSHIKLNFIEIEQHLVAELKKYFTILTKYTEMYFIVDECLHHDFKQIER